MVDGLKVGCVVIEQRLHLLSIVQRLRVLARAHVESSRSCGVVVGIELVERAVVGITSYPMRRSSGIYASYNKEWGALLAAVTGSRRRMRRLSVCLGRPPGRPSTLPAGGAPVEAIPGRSGAEGGKVASSDAQRKRTYIYIR